MKRIMIGVLFLFLSPAVHAEKGPTLEEVLNGADLNKVRFAWDQAIEGGDIIGNGAGSAESRFFHIYSILPQLIRICIESNECPVNGLEKSLLKEVARISKSNRRRQTHLIFLSSVKYPRFFKSANEVKPRIAKTGFSPGIPIFIDIEQVYNDVGVEVLSSGEIMGLLVHEIGHQTGVRSHTQLDSIGARLASFIQLGRDSITQMRQGRKVVVENFNFEKPDAFSSIHVYVDGVGQSITSQLIGRIRCQQPNSRQVGFQISNLHWMGRPSSSEKTDRLSFRAWIKLNCEDDQSNVWEEFPTMTGQIIFKPGGDFRVRVQFFRPQ